MRNMLYDGHLYYTYTPSVSTICVGNIAVGGTGKTPFVEYIVSLLHRKGVKVAVLSRGYGRKTSGFILATSAATTDTIGDEPKQISAKFPDVPLAVCEDRVKGIKRLTKLYPDTEVIVLDDAFQHRRVKCGYNILLTQADRLYPDDHLLPYGRLREHKHAAIRADVVCVTKCTDDIKPVEKRVIANKLTLLPCQDLYFSWQIYHNLPQSRCYLITGIAQPQYIIDKLGDKVIDKLIFNDHHRFRKKDFRLMEKTFSGDYPICTTEKDYYRLLDSPYMTENIRNRLHVVSIEVDLRQEKEIFEKKLFRYLSKF